MKSNPFFRQRTSTPVVEYQNSGGNSLAALMGRFRNESQGEDFCLKAKPGTAGDRNVNMLGSNMLGSNMLGSKYCEMYDQGIRNYQTTNKENGIWNNNSNTQNRYQQFTPRKQQQQQNFEQTKRQRSYSRSPINTKYFPDNSNNNYVFKAKQNKTLGNLIQLAQNYQNQNQGQNRATKMTSPNKILQRQYSNNQQSYNSRYQQPKPCLGLQDQQLQKQISILKQNLSNIALQFLPKQAISSAIHNQIQDFLSQLLPSRIPPQPVESLAMQTSQGIPINFSFDASYAEFTKGQSQSSKLQSSIQQNPNNTDLLSEQQGIKLLNSKTQQVLRDL